MPLPLIVTVAAVSTDKVAWFIIGMSYLIVGGNMVRVIKSKKNRELNDKNIEKQIHENYLETAT